ncbi:flagellar hook-associated protein FlgL [Colwellia sp. MB02u-18]|uniref:flagellar hook-associated protein FlgL n=1 Tax=unclassified Colwellia TaxID=196834 RepID=UPI0015F60258|nr:MULTISPECIES: flagellar hook-associated protein FlgL [unclassified Colwellia]MBA6223194.1 flagellar hook-associated protein FlgL [Colwellia sp. MB3u-45]MBA6265946.1 flagellar hook-associated protein FlgL [Colwellia sp. MB3u-43]MBA6320255.1 flagellar hook-associated protein FlgL [Colwellia sp. MB02u-19]MBA6323015.1 flagellar hook-associated protein FlgL [Colwellia sp. MB02u-18]MBA6329698.1 flagellar hook-associated protein FlgL [Colwellia sp. MB02u-12]
MRVSTAQFYIQSGLKMSNQQSNVNEQVNHISSGKQVITAKDDAVAYGTLAGYKNDLANIDKYQRNITQAENHNSLIDTSLANAEDIMNELKNLMLQANNGAYTADDLAAIGQQASQNLQQILGIANTQDQSGNYAFAGYQIDDAPFALQADNSVNYRGDNGVRELQIAKNVTIATNQSGEQVFEKVPNAIGDFSATYNNNTSGIAVERAVVADASSYNSAVNPADFTFEFSTATDLSITDGAGNVTNITDYAPGQTIAFNGIEVKLSGNPLPGDNFSLTPEQNVGVFDTIKSAIDWINTKAGSEEDAQVQVDFNQILNQLGDAINHLTSSRAESGINLQVIDRQKSNHLDTEVYLESGRASIEDLDFAKAISNFEQSKIALQAAQQTFTQVQGLSLFNYI